MHSPFQAVKAFWLTHFLSWLDKRSLKQNHHKLTTKNLYIFPTRKGFMFLLFVLVLWLLGTNYQNNLILALTFLLISIFIVSILHTFANLSGLDLELKGASNAFVGENVHFTIAVQNNSNRASNGVSISWQGSGLASSDFDCEAKSLQRVHVDISAKRRGHIIPKRLLVECEYPLGLLRCWTWLTFDAHALAYPAPMNIDLSNSSIEDDDGDGEHPVKGGEDFSAFREYQPGDPIKHIAWKLYARERGLYTKEFSHNISREIWLDFFQVQSQDIELKLSALCYWALEFSQRDENFGLVLPGTKIAPNKGENHKARVLEALARFESY